MENTAPRDDAFGFQIACSAITAGRCLTCDALKSGKCLGPREACILYTSNMLLTSYMFKFMYRNDQWDFSIRESPLELQLRVGQPWPPSCLKKSTGSPPALFGLARGVSG